MEIVCFLVIASFMLTVSTQQSQQMKRKKKIEKDLSPFENLSTFCSLYIKKHETKVKDQMTKVKVSKMWLHCPLGKSNIQNHFQQTINSENHFLYANNFVMNRLVRLPKSLKSEFG